MLLCVSFFVNLEFSLFTVSLVRESPGACYSIILTHFRNNFANFKICSMWRGSGPVLPKHGRKSVCIRRIWQAD